MTSSAGSERILRKDPRHKILEAGVVINLALACWEPDTDQRKRMVVYANL